MIGPPAGTEALPASRIELVLKIIPRIRLSSRRNILERPLIAGEITCKLYNKPIFPELRTRRVFGRPCLDTHR